MASGYYSFVAGAKPLASEWNDYVSKQSVMVFASTAARDSALSGVLREGMLSYQSDTNQYTSYDGAAWQIVAYGAAAGRIGGTWTRAASQSISNNTLTNISLDTETFDSSSFCTPPSTTITIPSGLGGLYMVTATVTYATATLSANYVQLNISGGTRTLPSNGNATNVQTASALLALVATDTVVLQTLHNNGGAQNATARIDLYRMGL